MTQLLKIKPENDDVKKMYTNHNFFHDGDVGLDLYTYKVEQVNEKLYKIDFGIQCQMTIISVGDNREYSDIHYCDDVSYYLIPRSSIVKTPFRMANSIGLIDAGYRGNIMAFVDSFDGSSPELNSRLFQLVPRSGQINKIQIVCELSKTSRGDGGFGSTGI